MNVFSALRRKKEASKGPRVFNVDYEQPFLNVCKQFLAFVLPVTKSLDILCRPWAPESGSNGIQLELPTWVPSLSGAAFDK